MPRPLLRSARCISLTVLRMAVNAPITTDLPDPQSNEYFIERQRAGLRTEQLGARAQIRHMPLAVDHVRMGDIEPRRAWNVVNTTGVYPRLRSSDRGHASVKAVVRRAIGEIARVDSTMRDYVALPHIVTERGVGRVAPERCLEIGVCAEPAHGDKALRCQHLRRERGCCDWRRVGCRRCGWMPPRRISGRRCRGVRRSKQFGR